MKYFLYFTFVSSLFFLSRSTPTLVESENFDAHADAQELHSALHGNKEDEATIREILSHRICSQRVEIQTAYKELFNEEITSTIAKKKSGTYEQLLKDLFLCGEDLQAAHLRRALANRPFLRKGIIEIMVIHTQSTEAHQNLINAYKRVFPDRTLDTDLKEDLRHNKRFQRVMLEMFNRKRRPKESANSDEASKTAIALNNNIKEWGDNNDLLDATLMETPFNQLELILNKFKEINGEDLESVIKDNFSKERRNSYQDLIHFDKTYANNHIEYYATRLHESVDGPGTDEQTLIRIILSHCEVDLIEIEEQFRKSYDRELKQKIARDTSGAFEGLLTAFLSKTPEEKKESEK